MKENTCCFIGHRTINETEKLKWKLKQSRFNDLSFEIVTEIKEKCPHKERIYVRADYPYIHDSDKAYLLKDYDDTYFPEKIIGAGQASYVERNDEMINSSRFCIPLTQFQYHYMQLVRIRIQ